jgi:hypothetical protein
VAVTDLAYAVEEAEGGQLFVTRLPYLPLRNGRGEWRLPLGAIRTVSVAEPPRAPTLVTPVERAGSLAVQVGRDGRVLAVETTAGLGDPALDAAVAALARTCGYRGGVGAAAVAEQPLALRTTLRIAPAAAPPVDEPPSVTLILQDGTEVAGAPAVAGVFAGRAGAGEYRLALHDCRSVVIATERK